MGLSPMDGMEDLPVPEIPPRIRFQVKIELREDGNNTRIIVSSREKGKPWLKNLEVAAQEFKVHSDAPLTAEPYMGDDHRHQVD